MMRQCDSPAVTLLGLQFALLVLFGVFTKYDKDASPVSSEKPVPNTDSHYSTLESHYAMDRLIAPALMYDAFDKNLAVDAAPAATVSESTGQSSSMNSGVVNEVSPVSTPTNPADTALYTARPSLILIQDVVLGVTLLYCQAALLCLYVGMVRYESDPESWSSRWSSTVGSFPVFQDVHVMIFVGFGFLMMFLRKYGYSAVGFTLLLGALMVQWAMLCQGFFRMEAGKIPLSILNLLNADVAAAAVLISLGAVLGKTTPLQLVVMGVVEMVCFAANEYLSSHVLQAVDLGGSMVVHVFGAYFGLAVSRALGRPSDTSKEASNYTSDMFAMVGTVFLWLFWPSFNGALAIGQARHRAVINTYLALAAGCVVAYAVSSMSKRGHHGGKFNMVHVQNATLAGGVAMGTAADLMVQPVGALVIGGLAGGLSVVGYAFLQPGVLKRLKVHDTCGVHNLHGMPGVMAGVIGAIMAAAASTDTYGMGLYLQFPAMTPASGQQLNDIIEYYPTIDPGKGRSPMQQAGYQLAALVASLLVSVVTGTITGCVIRQDKLFRQPAKNGLFDDEPHWDVPDEESGELPQQAVQTVTTGPSATTTVTTLAMATTGTISNNAATVSTTSTRAAGGETAGEGMDGE